MAVRDAIPRIPLQLTRGCVIASVQVDLDDVVLEQFETDLLERVASTGAHGVVLELSGLDVIDPHDFDGLRRIVTTAGIMGRSVVLVGMKPGVVASLVEMGVDIDGIRGTLTLESALDILEAGAA